MPRGRASGVKRKRRAREKSFRGCRASGLTDGSVCRREKQRQTLCVQFVCQTQWRGYMSDHWLDSICQMHYGIGIWFPVANIACCWRTRACVLNWAIRNLIYIRHIWHGFAILTLGIHTKGDKIFVSTDRESERTFLKVNHGNQSICSLVILWFKWFCTYAMKYARWCKN